MHMGSFYTDEIHSMKSVWVNKRVGKHWSDWYLDVNEVREKTESCVYKKKKQMSAWNMKPLQK